MTDSSRPRAVTFSSEITVTRVEISHKISMAKAVYEKFERQEVTRDMIQDAVELFNGNYGIWGPKVGSRAGNRVKLNEGRLKAQYLPETVPCSYARVTIENQLAGNAFACRWKSQGLTVCWVTQLVVHSDYRERGLAASLLNYLREDGDDVYGLMSSHPAACLAAVWVLLTLSTDD